VNNFCILRITGPLVIRVFCDLNYVIHLTMTYYNQYDLAYRRTRCKICPRL